MAGQTFNDTRIDQTVGWLLLGLVATAFFLLTILGMQNVQDNAKSVAAEPAHEEVETPVYDLAN